MRGSGLGSHYRLLDSHERLRLSVKAMARDDDVERDRIERSAPRVTYSMPESAFTDRMMIAERIVLAVLAEVGPVVANICLLRALQPLLEAKVAWTVDTVATAAFAAAPVEIAGSVLDAALESEDKTRDWLPRRFGQLETMLTAYASPLAHALAGFSRTELEIEPCELVAAFVRPQIATIEWLLEQPAESACVANYERFLTGTWRWGLGLQPDPSADPKPWNSRGGCA